MGKDWQGMGRFDLETDTICNLSKALTPNGWCNHEIFVQLRVRGLPQFLFEHSVDGETQLLCGSRDGCKATAY